MEKKIIATGNTFAAKSYLKEIGMEWNGEKKVWTANESKIDMARWEKLNNPTYIGRKIAKICSEIKLVAA